MSRRRTKPEEIKNKNHYFKRYVAKEALHDHIMQNDYKSMNVSFEQTLESKDRVVKVSNHHFKWWFQTVDKPAFSSS